jgi:nucleoside-triphosphatase
MPDDSPVILLTGRPGIGKTTVIKKVVSLLGADAGGFYTRELRTDRGRTGFEIVTLDGQRAYLASKGPEIIFASGVPFGKYQVNLDGIDSVAVPVLLQALDQGKVIVVDEIGPMEIRSRRFCDTVMRVLDSNAPVVGTVVKRPNDFADRVKAHARVTVTPVTSENRDTLPSPIVSALARSTGN